MKEIKGIFAASMSILDENLTLNSSKTILHVENLIDQGCHGVAIFGSTGQAQLIPIGEKVNLLNKLSVSKYKNKYLIGTGLNSLGETINLMKISTSLGFNKFLIGFLDLFHWVLGSKYIPLLICYKVFLSPACLFCPL